MKKIVSLCLLLLAASGADALDPGPCSVVTYSPRVPVTPEEFAAMTEAELPDEYFRISVQHFDRLGRDIGSVAVGEGGAGEDIATLIEYNPRNLPFRQWVPVPFAAATGARRSPDEFAAASDFYKAHHPYTETDYEYLPSARPISVARPDTVSKPKRQTLSYSVNEASGKYALLRLEVSGDSLVCRGYHKPRSVYANTVAEADGATAIEFSTVDGRTLLRRRLADDGDFNDTYYVYDFRGDVRVILQPEASAAIATGRYHLDCDLLRSLAFVYSYDAARRVYTSRAPGVEPVYYVYDRLGRLTMWQDGVRRAAGEWFVRKYDRRLRPAVEGICRSSRSHRWWWERMDTSMMIESVKPTYDADLGLFYTDSGTVPSFSPLRAWLYDNHDFAPADVVPDRPGFAVGRSLSDNGLLTAEVLMDGIPLVRAFWYDDYGRVVASVEYDTFGQRYRLSNFYRYDFRGNVIEAVSRHENVSENTVIDAREFHTRTEYDRADRPVNVEWRIRTSDPWKLLHTYTYDAVGRMESAYDGAGVNTVYSFDINGRLTATDSPVFSQQLHYNSFNESPYTSAGIAAAIENYHLKTEPCDTVLYTYDRLGRLTHAKGRRLEEYFSYDANSNITQLTRYYDRSPVAGLYFGLSGNRITMIEEAASDRLAGVVPKIPAGYYPDVMAYDANGRITRDDSRDIRQIVYTDFGDYPGYIEMDSAHRITFSYRPDGVNTYTIQRERRLEPFTRVNSKGDTIRGVRTVDHNISAYYYGNFENRSGRGWIYRVGSDFYTFSDSTMHFTATDHLGSTRAVYRQYRPIFNQFEPLRPPAAVTIMTHTVEQRTGYYASGLPVDYGDESVTDRLHIGNEWINIGGLGYYNNTARLHDAILGRFHVPDPCAESYTWLSPYTHCAANPVNLIDPDGRDIFMLDQQGCVISIDPNEDHDEFHIVDENNNIIEGKSLVFSKRIVEKYRDANYQGKPFSLYQIRGDQNTQDVFEFLATNTSVEWAYFSTGISGDSGLNFLTTSYDNQMESGGGSIFNLQLIHGYTVRQHIHNHPSNSVIPSGLRNPKNDKSGDINFSKYIENALEKHIDFYIYTPDSKLYVPYNPNSKIEDFDIYKSINQFILNNSFIIP